MKLKLSIIVPIYNVEVYVERCLYSIVREQEGLTDYEILCINDGSTDGSGDIVERMVSQYPQISVIHQENKGVGAARNKGLNMAKGKYIMFIDPDDFYAPNSLVDLIKLMEGSTCDIITFTVLRTTEDSLPLSDETMEFSEHCLSEFYSTFNFSPFCVAYIYKRELIGGLKFREDLIVCEDMVFVETVCLRAKSLGRVDAKIYGYFSNPGSVMNLKSDSSRNIKFANDYLSGLKEINALYKQNNSSELEAIFLFRSEYKAYFFLKRLKDRGFSFSEAKQRLNDLGIKKFVVLGDVVLKYWSWRLRRVILNYRLTFFLAYTMPVRKII